MYVDDESFQDLAEGKVFHDAKLLARVLYGEEASESSGETTKVIQDGANQSKRRKEHIQFKEEVGNLTIDSTLLKKMPMMKTASLCPGPKIIHFSQSKLVKTFSS